MKAIELTAPRVDALHFSTYSDPIPGLGDELVRLRAASLNFLDITVATGKYPLNKFPIIPVTDGADEIAALGTAVTEWKVGDRVIPHFIPNWQDGRMPTAGGGPRRGIDLPGSLAEYVVVPAHSLVRTPAHLSDAEAATLPIAATTAWRAVRSADWDRTKQPSCSAPEVSRFLPCSSQRRTGRVSLSLLPPTRSWSARKLGADEVINYKSTPKWADEVLRLTEGRGADLVLETGGTATFPQSIEAAGLDSTVFIIGFLSGTEVAISVVPMMKAHSSAGQQHRPCD